MQLYRYFEINEKNKFNSKSTDVKVAQLENDYTIPFEYLELQLCKLFHCLPSQLRKEDYSKLTQLYAIDNAIEQYKSWVNSDDKLPLPLKLHLEILKLEKALGE